MQNNGKFAPEHLPMLRQHLESLDDMRMSVVSTVPLKDPTMSLIISLFVGTLGIDRFLIGDIGMGVGKLLTCGGCGIWTIVDWFLIMGATKQKNFDAVMQIR
jgi:TM2 domain-containing membrane protein YozV